MKLEIVILVERTQIQNDKYSILSIFVGTNFELWNICASFIKFQEATKFLRDHEKGFSRVEIEHTGTKDKKGKGYKG